MSMGRHYRGCSAVCNACLLPLTFVTLSPLPPDGWGLRVVFAGQHVCQVLALDTTTTTTLTLTHRLIDLNCVVLAAAVAFTPTD